MVSIIQDYSDFARGIFKNKTKNSYFLSLNCHLLKSAHLVLFLYKGGVDVNIAEHIKTQRKKQGLNQEELAERLDVSIKTIQRWEWGQRSPRAEELQKLASALNTTSAYLLGDADDPRPVKSTDTLEPSQSEINFAPVNMDAQAERIKEVKSDRGTLRYSFGSGREIEVPDTPANQEWFREIVMRSLFRPDAVRTV